MISRAAAGALCSGKSCGSTPAAPSGCCRASRPCWPWRPASRCRRSGCPDGLLPGPVRVPGHRRRRPHAADRDHRHGRHGHRAGARPHGGRAAAVLDPVLAAAAAQLPARPRHPGRAERLHRHLRLQRRRPVHGRRGGGHAGPRTSRGWRSAARSCLLFASLGMVVYFADHLVHSIQIDAITRQVEKNTRQALRRQTRTNVTDEAPRAPAWAITAAQPADRVRADHPPGAAAAVGRTSTASRSACELASASTWSRARRSAWVWAASRRAIRRPTRRTFEAAVNSDVRIGFERTLEQDVAFGIRQLIDIASKALSPAINDPYTAVQAIDHLAAVCADLATPAAGHQHR